MKVINNALVTIKKLIKELSALEKQLTTQGCINAYIHFKTGTNKMYLLEPVVAGKRKFHYVGVDPEKQQAARDHVQRFKQREQVRAAIAQ
ncbi:MAG: hypothetical protein OEW97_08020, partial [Gammaproteobacteria bacterium]|nr:hypothetical protein [Gammaproteobacteria bacterium]